MQFIKLLTHLWFKKRFGENLKTKFSEEASVFKYYGFAQS